MASISIITICFNNLADLQKTCVSVDAQIELPFEHWIIDGSTNNEIENWLLHTPQPGYRKSLHERDKGIADAFNKGIGKAAGPITQLLNSGDILAQNDVLVNVSAIFEKNPSLQWISGKIRMIRAGKEVVVGKAFEKSKLYRGMRSVSHPTWFVKKEVYERVGLFKSDYKIAMDYDLMCRLKAEPYAFLPKEIVVFDDAGISSTRYLDSLRESRVVYESYFGYSFLLVLWQWRLMLLHYLLQTKGGKWLFDWKKKMGWENA